MAWEQIPLRASTTGGVPADHIGLTICNEGKQLRVTLAEDVAKRMGVAKGAVVVAFRGQDDDRGKLRIAKVDAGGRKVQQGAGARNVYVTFPTWEGLPAKGSWTVRAPVVNKGAEFNMPWPLLATPLRDATPIASAKQPAGAARK